jgi:hypothetical protein
MVQSVVQCYRGHEDCSSAAVDVAGVGGLVANALNRFFCVCPSEQEGGNHRVSTDEWTASLILFPLATQSSTPVSVSRRPTIKQQTHTRP